MSRRLGYRRLCLTRSMHGLKISATVLRGDDYPAELNQRLLYCLQPSQKDTQTPVLSVWLRSVRLLKGGDFASNYAQPSTHDFAVERAPKYYREGDIEILTQLSRRSSRYTHGAQPLPAELVQRIVATGRAYWLDHKRSPLRWAEPREGRVEWRQASKRGIVPHLIVPGLIALNAEPPVYVDEAERNDRAGGVEPAAAAWQPAVVGAGDPACPGRGSVAPSWSGIAGTSPRAAARHARARGCDRRGSDPGLAPAARPRAFWRLLLRYKRDIDRPIAVAHLSFRYGPIEIEASERASWLEAFHAGQVYSITRRPGKERAARKRLSDFEFCRGQGGVPVARPSACPRPDAEGARRLARFSQPARGGTAGAGVRDPYRRRFSLSAGDVVGRL